MSHLEILKLGTLIQTSARKKPTVVFVKTPPAEAAPVLAVNNDLCSVDFYETRYHGSMSKSINLYTRHKLAKMGVLSAKQLVN